MPNNDMRIPGSIPDPPRPAGYSPEDQRFVKEGEFQAYEVLHNSELRELFWDLPEVFRQFQAGEIDSAYRVALHILSINTYTEIYRAAVDHFGFGVINDLLSNYATLVVNDQAPGGDYNFQFSNDSYLRIFGEGFESPNELDSRKRVYEKVLKNRRENTPPLSVSAWQCRIGLARFLVPPTNVTVTNTYKTSSLTGGTIRQSTSAKFNSGHSETIIDMRLYFPSSEQVWGIGGERRMEIDFNNDDDPKIDRFFSSLRGLIIQFKYAPFLPVRHKLLNQVYNITGVAMENMSISTIPDYPECYVVDLRMKSFNHKVFLEPIEDFNNAFDYGLFRAYLGRGAEWIERSANKGFLLKQKPGSITRGAVASEEGGNQTTVHYDYEFGREPMDKIKYDREAGLLSGKYLKIFYPKSTPGRVFTPDMANFRQQGENIAAGARGKSAWEQLLGRLGIDVNTHRSAIWEYLDTTSSASGQSGDFSARGALYAYLENLNYIVDNMDSDRLEEFIEQSINAHKERTGSSVVSQAVQDQIRQDAEQAWFLYMFNSWKNLPYFQQYRDSAVSADNLSMIREWEVPMEQYEIDYDKVILEGSSVNISNNFATLQVQLQETPTYQHISGGDSTMTFQFRVFGEEALSGFQRVMRHINGLARLENSRGVLGFIGLQHTLSALCGIKFGLPLSFSVETVDDHPNVYSVTVQFTDFDLLQQRREELSSEQQRELVAHFNKRNPFFRIKQMAGIANPYPDMPLQVRDDEGKIIGSLDPDYYFRSFQHIDDDIVHWNDIDFNRFDDFTRGSAEGVVGTEDLEKLLDVVPGSADSSEHEVNSSSNTLAGRIGQESHYVTTYLGFTNGVGTEQQFIEQTKDGFAAGSQNIETGESTYTTDNFLNIREDAASNVQTTPTVRGMTPGSQHVQPMLTDNPMDQFELMMTDAQYRDVSGRMVRAFPTYMLWFIDEGGTFAGVKLFDNFYNVQSVIDFSLVSSEDILGDTLVLRLSNIYSRLTTRYKGRMETKLDSELDAAGFGVLQDLDEYYVNTDDPALATEDGDGLLYILGNTYSNLVSGTTDSIRTIDRIRLKPGVRVHLRTGYGNVNTLETVFNGTITEVEQGDIVTITAQSDAIELSPTINTTNKESHSGTIDGSLFNGNEGFGMGLWLSEPRDLMIRLLTMGSSTFREMISYATNNMIFSENKFGIRHFGMMLYEPLSDREREKMEVRNEGLQYHSAQFFESVSNMESSSQSGSNGAANAVAGVGYRAYDAFAGLNAIRPSVAGIMQSMWIGINRDPDYEVFKRNIYPGNGFGVAQFLGGDFSDGGLAVAAATSAQEDFWELDPDGVVAGVAQGGSVYNSDVVQRILAVGGDQRLADARADVEANNNGGSSWVSQAIDFGFGGFLNSTLLGSIYTGFATNDGELTLPGGVRPSDIASTFSRFAGLTTNLDDDLADFDEVSFRAQTYMKSVWDLFQLCAALLPNYIVAVRPFEDRSTVFYGKPHWLYTSGLIPVTTGLPADSAEPQIRQFNEDMASLFRQMSEETSSLQDLESQAEYFDNLNQKVALEDPRATYPGDQSGSLANLDPDGNGILTDEEMLLVAYAGGFRGDAVPQAAAIAFAETDGDMNNNRPGSRIAGLWQIDTVAHNVDKQRIISDPVYCASIALRVSSNGTNWNPWSVYGGSHIYQGRDDVRVQALSRLRPLWNQIGSSIENGTYGGGAITAPTYGDVNSDTGLVPWLQDAINEARGITPDSSVWAADDIPRWFTEAARNIAPNPIIYEVVGGHKDIAVPVWIDPDSGIYTVGAGTNTGETARLLYDAEYNELVANTNNQPGIDPVPPPLLAESGKTFKMATEIWYDLRLYWRDMEAFKNAWKNVREIAPTKTEDKPGEINDVWSPQEYIDLGLIFLNMVWNDPRARAWVVITADERVDNSQIPLSAVGGGLLGGGIAGLPGAIGGAVAGAVADFVTGGDAPNIDLPIFDTGPSRWLFAKLAQAFELWVNEFGSSSLHQRATEYSPYILPDEILQWMMDNMEIGDIGDKPLEGLRNAWDNFFERNLAALITAVASNIQGTVNMFRMSLMSLGYGLNMVGQMQKQANILNRFYNDSIYYDEGQFVRGSIPWLADNCLAGETGVWTKDGVKKIKDLVGQEVPILTNRGWHTSPIKSFGKQRLMKITLSRVGVERVIYATPEHRWFIDVSKTGGGVHSIERYTKDLVPGNRLTRVNKPLMPKALKPSRWGIAHGFVFGDGWRVDNRYTEVSLWGEKDAPMSKYFDLCDTLTVKSANGFEGTKIKCLPRHWKDLPDLNESQSYLFGWLVGYFAADGCVSKNGVISLNSNVRENLEFVQKLCVTRLGILTYEVKTHAPTTSSFGCGESYSLIFVRSTVPESMFSLDQHRARFLRSTKNKIKRWSIKSIEPTDRYEEVYCAEVRGHGRFVLEGLILTGNCFTREYGEPVIEIREPFQRVHYLNSFQHILNNGMQETLDNVPTVITATSDGKNPVTVHLDKGIPSNLQVERVVETGLFWDNVGSSGFFSTLHPLLHPIETARGFTKAQLGSSDQLMSRRVALHHLKEGVKDIYGGEIIIIGDADIRPHDLIWIGDSYTKTFGIVECEQVVHHFNAEMGFITSITPNAVVTVNDPARWSMLSWLGSWMSVKEFRDTVRRRMLSSNTTQASGTAITLDQLALSMDDVIRGGTQYTLGSTAIVKDLMAARAVGLMNYESVASDSSTGDTARALSQFGSGLAGTFTMGLSTAVTDWTWDAWDWVRENLLDRQGLYISFVNRNGEPMDGGLSSAQGVAVGRTFRKRLLPGLLGLTVDDVVDGNRRLTYDDMMAELGYNETDFQQFRQETSYWTSVTRAHILDLTGQTPGGGTGPNLKMPDVIVSTVDQVVDGDTIILSNGDHIRLEGLLAPELWDKANINNSYLDYRDDAGPLPGGGEVVFNYTSPNNRGRLATIFLQDLLLKEGTGTPPVVAVRINPEESNDIYGRKLGVVFYRVPPSLGITDPEEAGEILRRYATSWPLVAWDGYMEDGIPYTLNWAVIMTGLGVTDATGLSWNNPELGIDEFQK